MNEIERAIAYFEDAVRESDEIIEECSPALQTELTEQKQHFTTALVALREQSDEECDSRACAIANERDCLREEILEIKAEQEKGCEYCNDTDYISEGQQKIETAQWDEYEDGFIVIRQHINFCPMCGKKLEEHNE